MGGNKKVNSDLDIKGKVKISTVPNKQGAVLIHDPITKEISTRTNLEFVNDLDLPTKDYVSQSISSNNQNYIPKSQINQPNGLAGLDANGVVPSNRIDDRLKDKILMMTGEFYDRFISGFRDRNLLIDAYYNASQFDIDIVGNGSMDLGLEYTKKILTNSESNFIYFNNVDSSSQVVITIVYPTLFNNFSNGVSWQCIIENRLNNFYSFQDIKVETIGTEGVWNECYNVQNVQNIRDTGMYSFPVGDYNFSKNYPQFPFGIKGIRVTLSNPNSNIAFLSNIIFRHLSNTLAPQFPHIGQDNKFYETNKFKKPLIIPNGISSNHAITLAQLNGYVSISALNVQLDNYVTKNGSVTINGTKTFMESPVVPTPTINTHAVNKSYVDGNYIPYTGANTNVDLGDNTFKHQGILRENNVIPRILTTLPYSLVGKNAYNVIAQGYNVFTSINPKIESETRYQSGFIGFGNNLMYDFTGNTNYRPSHPAHDSHIVVGTDIGKGFIDGTNTTMMGTTLMHKNDIPYVDSLTVFGKGITNAVAPFNDPNRVCVSISNGFNLRDMMKQNTLIGNELWFGDVHTSTIVAQSVKVFRYAFNSVVIGNEIQDYTGVKYPGETSHMVLDNDIIIGSGIYKDPKKYSQTHNLIIGNTIGYGNGTWNPNYVPLIEGNFLNPYLRVNGKLEISTKFKDETLELSTNKFSGNQTGWTDLGNNNFSANNTNSDLVSMQLVAGKSYLLIIKPSGNGWISGEWGYDGLGISDSGNSGTYSVTKFITAPANGTFKITTINGVGQLNIKLHEVDLNSVTNSSFKFKNEDGIVINEVRPGSLGANCMFWGLNSGQYNVAMKDVVAMGTDTLRNSKTSFNTVAIGSGALSNADVHNSVGIGFNALKNSTRGNLVAIGSNVMVDGSTDLHSSIGIGTGTLKKSLKDNNVGIGNSVLSELTTGIYNTSLGSLSGYQLTTGSFNTYIGNRTWASSPDVTNEIVVGGNYDNVQANIGKGSNTAKWGNDNTEHHYMSGDLETTGGFKIKNKDDNSVLTAGGNSAHKKELLWSRKLTIQPSSTNAYYPEPQGQVTNIDITGHGSIDATVYLPQEAYNGQIINIVNYSAEKIKISGIDAGEFGIGQDTMVTMTFVFNTNNIDGVTYGTGRWVGMYMNEFNKLE